MNLSRRMILSGLLASAAVPAWAEAPERSIRPLARASDLSKQPKQVKRAIKSAEDMVAEARLGGKVSFAVADARTGELLETGSPLLGQPPASTAKALTSLYALETLGPQYRFTTRLVATGPVTNGRIDGDLVLVGGGDPTLDTNALAEMAADLKKAGVREISGKFRVWAGAMPYVRALEPAQPDHLSYNPSLSGLNLNYNRVHFEWKQTGSDYSVTMDARAGRYRPDVTVARMSVVDRSLPVYTYADANGRDEWTVARSALGSGGARWLPVRRPDLYAGEVLQTLARSQGIILGDSVEIATSDQGTELVTRKSAPLPDVLRDMLKYSTNLTAELVGLTTSAQAGGSLRGLIDSAAHMNGWLKRTGDAGSARLVDHSGLSGESRISAADMVSMLVKAPQRDMLRGLMKSYPLEDRPDVVVQAKTGTLNFVSALVGYVSSPGSPDLAFAIFCADPPRRDALSEAEMESPDGGKAWLQRARRLQRQLLARWSSIHAT